MLALVALLSAPGVTPAYTGAACAHSYCSFTAVNEPPADGADDCPQVVMDATGMPVWWVSEPFVSLRLEDEPLGYRPARGPRVAFHLSYRQRGNPPPHLHDNLTGVGPNWSSSFRAYLSVTLTNDYGDAASPQFSPEWEPAPGQSTNQPVAIEEKVKELDLHRVGAGFLRYTLIPDGPVQGTHPHPMDSSVIRVLTGDCPDPRPIQSPDPSSPTDRCVLGFELQFRDGSMARFMQRLSVDLNPFDDVHEAVFLVTSWSDPAGLSLTFHYDPQHPAKLLSVTDADGLATVLRYEDARFHNRITSVTDPYGRACHLAYDAEGYLTNVVDVAQMASSFAYDTGARRGWITNLTTPYGQTRFRHGGQNAETERSFFATGGVVNRFIEITEASGAKQLYLYRHDCAGLDGLFQPPLPDTWSLPHALESGCAERNSFHWGRLQHAHLNAGFLATGNPAALSPADYAIARARHWLRSPNDLFPISDVLSSERLPSPDGLEPGAWTWFDYAGKSYGPDVVGLRTEVSMVARWLRLPDQQFPQGESQVAHFIRNDRGLIREVRESYTRPDGTPGLRWRGNTYDSRLDLVAQHGPGGELRRTNIFNSRHQLTATADALGQWTYLEYDAASWQLTNIIHPGGLQTSFRYDPATRRLVEAWETPAGRRRLLAHGPDGLPATLTDERGVTLTLQWDALQRLTRVGFPDGTSIEHQYRHLDRVATKDRLGHWSRVAYNAVRQPLFVTNVLGTVTAYDWCGCGALQSAIAGFGSGLAETNSFTYDLQGRLRQIRRPDLTTESLTFDAAGRPATWSDGLVRRSFHYNLQGLLAEVFNGAGREISLAYDEYDRLLQRIDAAGVATTFTYDPLGRLREHTVGGWATERFGYTPNVARPTSHWDPLNQETRFTYDPAGRLLQVVNRNQESNQFIYDPSGLLTALVDGWGLVTQWQYDAYGRLTNKLDQTGASVLRLTHDANGRVLTRWTPAKGATHYHYDPLGNVVFVDHPASPDVVLRYNLLGRLTNVVDASGSTSFHYHRGGSLSQESGPWPASQLVHTYQAGRRVALRLTQPKSAWTNGFAYDAAGRLDAITSPAGVFQYLYPPDSASPRLAGIALPNGARIALTHDFLGRLTDTELRSSQGGLLNAHRYSHDAAHRRIGQVLAVGGTAEAMAYEYDPLGQLTGAMGSDGVAPVVLGYDYDAAGNLLARLTLDAEETFQPDALNQLTASTPTGANTYDANGNLLTSHHGQRHYTYDDDNRLTRLIRHQGGTPSGRTDFVYDAFGRLRVRQEYTWVPSLQPQPPPAVMSASTTAAGGGGASTYSAMAPAPSGQWSLAAETRYLYDGWRVIQERNGSNLPEVSYTRGLDLGGGLEAAGGIGGLLGRSSGYNAGNGRWNTHHHYHADGAGNVTALLDAAQGVAARYGYDPFGNLLWHTGPLADANRYRFSSKELHPASGLYYYGHRFYDPRTQRWLTRDPIGEAGGINLYGFVGNAPISAVDPLGLMGLPHPTAENRISWPVMADVQQEAAEAVAVGAMDWSVHTAVDLTKSSMQFTIPGVLGGYDGLFQMLDKMTERFDEHIQTITTGFSVEQGYIYAYTPVAIDLAGVFLTLGYGIQGMVCKGAARNAPSSLWSKAEFNGTRVYQRNDLINPALVDARGRSNLQRMQQGLAPIGPDGKSINLHHTIQTADSPLAEMTATFHQQNSRVIHINPNTIPSGIDRPAFDAFRRDYWINRANDFSP